MRRFFRLMLLGCWGATPSAADPLLDASRTNQSLHTNRLIASGADVRQRGPHGDTALHWAVYHGRKSLVAQLIARGADVDATVDNGNTPLHQAAYRGHTGIVELLITQGAELNRRTRNGVTPLGWAKRNGHNAVVELLIAHGARDGATPAPTQTVTLARRQQDHVSRRTDPLPDAVLFAALTYLPSPKGKPVSVSDTPEPEPSLTVPPQRSERLSGYRVQLAAMRSEARAREMWQQYVVRHPAILGSLQLSVEPAQVNGVSFYRVQGGPLSTQVAAHNVCDELLRNKQACMVVGASRFLPVRTAHPTLDF